MSRPIATITVVGAGPLGRELAGRAIQAGYRTLLEDLSGEWRRRFGDDPALTGVEWERDLVRAASQADLILEAAPDDFETKFEVYTLLDRAAAPSCLFASTSPAWPVAEIASFTYRAPLVVGVWSGKLVRGPETSDLAAEAVARVLERLDSWNGTTSFSNDRTASGS